MQQTISFILSITGLIILIAASLIKGEKMTGILMMLFVGDVLVATSYLFTEAGLSGGLASFVGAVQAIINYFFAAKEKPLPKWLIFIYALSFGAVSMMSYAAPVDILALLASLAFVAMVSAKNGTWYRIWLSINSIVWILYDILSQSYGPLATHTALCVFTLLGLVINDLKKGEKA